MHDQSASVNLWAFKPHNSCEWLEHNLLVCPIDKDPNPSSVSIIYDNLTIKNAELMYTNVFNTIYHNII